MEVKSLAANSAAVVLAVLFGSAPAGLAMESDTSPAPLSEEGWCAGALHPGHRGQDAFIGALQFQHSPVNP